jgi:hypothetical protein
VISDRPTPITSRQFVAWMIECGVLQPDDWAYRVVIDANPEDVVRIYVERAGDERLIRVTPPKGLELAVEPAVRKGE